MTETIAVLGAGSWGTALAIQLANNGHRCLLWDHFSEHIEALSADRENKRYLPGTPLPAGVEPTASLEVALAMAKDILLVVPSEFFRQTLKTAIASGDIRQGSGMIWATKGLEVETGKWLHEVVEEELDGDIPYALLSGPSFAKEVARGLPTAVTVGSFSPVYAQRVAGLFHGQNFRVYTSDDVVGVELGGSVKNVLAIATGVSDGLGFGANARAALITRGLSEIMRLGSVVGASNDTLMGLAGLGDLVLTCTDDQSRNRRLGLALGRGQNKDEAIREIGQAVEGAVTAKVIMRVATAHNVEMPICEQVFKILYEAQSPEATVANLLGRDLKPETA